MKRWIVNPRTHEVRESFDWQTPEEPREGEFLFDAPTSADAAMAGRRHNLAVEALEAVEGECVAAGFKVIGERLELASESDTATAGAACALLMRALEGLGFEVWREGLALLVLGRRVQGAGSTEGIHAWVSEIGSDR